MLLYYLNTPILFTDNWFSIYNLLVYFNIQDLVNGSFVLILPRIFQRTHPVKETLSYQTINILVLPYSISSEMELCHHRIYSVYCIQWNETLSHRYLVYCSIQHPVKWSCVTLLHCLLFYTASYQLKFSNTINLHILVKSNKCIEALVTPLSYLFQYTLSSKIKICHSHYPAN